MLCDYVCCVIARPTGGALARWTLAVHSTDYAQLLACACPASFKRHLYGMWIVKMQSYFTHLGTIDETK